MDFATKLEDLHHEHIAAGGTLEEIFDDLEAKVMALRMEMEGAD